MAGSVDSRSYEDLLVANLDLIDAAVAFIARRHRLSSDESQEFACDVRLKLIEHDYAVLRKFEGRSSLRTYLTVVIQRLFLDRRAAQWGKWRPSALARREGRTAMLLEQLTARQGMSFDQACSVLESVHVAGAGRAALKALYDRLPARSRRHFVGEEALRHVCAADGHPEAGIRIEAGAATASRAVRALAAQLARLSPGDRQIIDMRYAQGMSVADIARSTSRDPKLLYRRLQRLLDDLRRLLEAQGVSRAEVAEVIGCRELDPPSLVDCRDAR